MNRLLVVGDGWEMPQIAAARGNPPTWHTARKRLSRPKRPGSVSGRCPFVPDETLFGTPRQLLITIDDLEHDPLGLRIGDFPDVNPRFSRAQAPVLRIVKVAEAEPCHGGALGHSQNASYLRQQNSVDVCCRSRARLPRNAVSR